NALAKYWYDQLNESFMRINKKMLDARKKACIMSKVLTNSIKFYINGNWEPVLRQNWGLIWANPPKEAVFMLGVLTNAED
ncbi:MAG: hypothetical protein ACRD43_14920, partial [Pyrinomonadaceae bacterium]